MFINILLEEAQTDLLIGSLTIRKKYGLGKNLLKETEMYLILYVYISTC